MRRCGQCHVDYPDALEYCPRDGVKLPPLPGATQALYDPLIGSTIDGRYLVEALLGEGGMGMVYAARHAIIDKRVAIKVLRKEAAADESSAQRFLAEAKAASKIGQQNIVDITDFGVLTDGHAYFVMEFLDGPTLGQIMARTGPLPPARAVAIAEQVCRGLHAAHTKGIIHRDLKPENIFILVRDGMNDFVKIVDFGIARDASTTKRLTVAGMVMGTPEYMAPEQASGQESDHRVDQYALGCILYEMVTGAVPFRGENPMQTLTKHVFEAPRPPSALRPDLTIPRELEAIILRAIAKKRDERFAGLDELQRTLGRVAPALRDIQIPAHAQRRHADGQDAPAADGRDPDPADGDTQANALGAGGDTAAALRALRPARRRGLVVGVAAAVLVAGALLAVTLRPRAVTAPAVVDAPSRAPASPVAAPPSAAAAAATISLALSTQPPGAQVFLHDELLGVTPVTITQPASPTESLPLVFRKAGYRDTERAVAAAKDAYVDVVLPREPTPRPPAAPKSATSHKVAAHRAGKAGPVSVPQPPSTPPQRPRNSELRNPFDEPGQK